MVRIQIAEDAIVVALVVVEAVVVVEGGAGYLGTAELSQSYNSPSVSSTHSFHSLSSACCHDDIARPVVPRSILSTTGRRFRVHPKRAAIPSFNPTKAYNWVTVFA